MKDSASIKKIIDLINADGKHASYQELPAILRNSYGDLLKEMNWIPSRLDIPRLKWVIDSLNAKKINKIVDIGANTGFFSFELMKAFGATCTAYEPHAPHAKAMGVIKEICNTSDSDLKIENSGVSLNDIENLDGGDLLIFLNVLHHAGDDFDRDKVGALSEWSKYSVNYLNGLSCKFDYMFFQLGNAWKGSSSKIFKDKIFFAETKKMLEESGWIIESVGLIENFLGEPRYEIRQLNSSRGSEDFFREIHGFRKFFRYCGNRISFNVDYKFMNRPLYLCRSATKKA